MRISDWSSDVCSSDLLLGIATFDPGRRANDAGADDMIGHRVDDLAGIAIVALQVARAIADDLLAGPDLGIGAVAGGPPAHRAMIAARSVIGPRVHVERAARGNPPDGADRIDRKSTRLKSSH